VTIEFYTWSTPNGRKISIALEEMELAYNTHTVNIGQNEQFAPEFVAISPSMIPAIVDPEGPDGEPISVFETGAILLYLARKTGRFLPEEGRARSLVEQWLMWQMGNFGPMLGQVHHFRRFHPEKAPYSIADMAILPWAARHPWQGIALPDYPNVKRWYDALAERPGVNRGMEVPEGKPSGWTPPES
jgi:GST-like protein